MPIKPAIPKGTRDFNPKQVAQRRYIMDTIREVFELYGFEPIETPSMENMETLTGKYGEEGDKLLFKILNSGDYLKDVPAEMLSDSPKLASHIAEKGLRYDLTVPLARYVVMHRHEITFPFKRYQIQPVWRADRPQKGRYREFWQCDADVIGSSSLANDAELILMLDEVFRKLRIRVRILLNHRSVLKAIANSIGVTQFMAFATVVDKLDRIGIDGVIKELHDKGLVGPGLSTEQTGDAWWWLRKAADTPERLERDFKSHIDELGQQGASQITRIHELVDHQISNDLMLCPYLARGLDYYTGAIFEVVSGDLLMGSVASGGRYDNLTELFGLEGVPGVGISFGLERINDVMEELGLFKELQNPSSKILITWFDQKGFNAGWKLLEELRAKGISSEIYPDEAKMAKQLKYADAKSFAHVIIIGDEELKSGNFTVKNMKTGEQRPLTRDDILSNKLA